MSSSASARKNKPVMAVERSFTGLGVSHGIAIGPAFIVQLDNPKAPQYKIDNVESETKRFT